jgi:hypothetical protein
MKGITPMAIVRALGPLGQPAARYLIRMRISWMPETSAFRTIINTDHLMDYMYHSWALPGSGEAALSHLLWPGAWAKRPLMDHFQVGPIVDREQIPTPKNHSIADP